MMRKPVGVLLVAVLAALVLVSPASAAKPTGLLTAPLTVGPTVIQIDGLNFTVSGAVTADVTQFKLNKQGNLVAVATLSGTLTISEPTLGRATIDVTGTRVVLRARVQADCSGHLHIDFTGVVRLNATVTNTSTTGATTTVPISETVPLHGSLDFTAQTQEQRALICDVSHLIRSGAPLQEVVDTLAELLGTL
jgi:hypothetical protein